MVIFHDNRILWAHVMIGDNLQSIVIITQYGWTDIPDIPHQCNMENQYHKPIES